MYKYKTFYGNEIESLMDFINICNIKLISICQAKNNNFTVIYREID